jgi:hypothetical protein
MKAILEFNLPEDHQQYAVFMQADRMQSFLWDFSQQLRSWDKYHNDFTDSNDALDKIRTEFYRLISQHNIDLDI